MTLTKEQVELIKELFELKLDPDLYPSSNNGKLEEPSWRKIERFKEIKQILGIDYL